MPEKGTWHSQLRHYRQLHVESKAIKSLVSVKYVSCEVYQIICSLSSEITLRRPTQVTELFLTEK